MSEPEIAGAIDEVRPHEAAAGTPAEAEFGPAEECAKRSPKRKRRTRVRTVPTVGAALSIPYVLVAVLLLLVFRADIRPFVGPLTLPPVAMLVLASVLVGVLTDNFNPRRATALLAEVPGTGRVSPRRAGLR